MADITLKAYYENGALADTTARYLDIIQIATPTDAPEVKNLTPLYRDYTYSIFIRQPGTKWELQGVQDVHMDHIEVLRAGLKYLWKVTAVNSALPDDIRALEGKYLRILAIKSPKHVKEDILPWNISAMEVKTL